MSACHGFPPSPWHSFTLGEMASTSTRPRRQRLARAVSPTTMARTADGRESLADLICGRVKLGMPLERAAIDCGIEGALAEEWYRTGMLCRIRHTNELSAHERACVRFAQHVEQAKVRFESSKLERLEAAGAGGRIRERVVERWEIDSEGNEKLVSRRIERDEMAPDPQWDAWLLERSLPQWRKNMEISGPAGGPIPVGVAPMKALGDLLDKVAAKQGQIDALNLELPTAEPGPTIEAAAVDLDD